MKLRHKLLTLLFFLVIPGVAAEVIPASVARVFYYVFGRSIPPVYSQKAIFAIIIMCVLLVAFRAMKWKGNIPITLSIVLATISGIGVPPSLTQAMFNTWGVVGGIVVNLVVAVLLLVFAHTMAGRFGEESPIGKLIKGVFYILAGGLFYMFAAQWGALEFGGQSWGALASMLGLILMIIGGVTIAKFIANSVGGKQGKPGDLGKIGEDPALKKGMEDTDETLKNLLFNASKEGDLDHSEDAAIKQARLNEGEQIQIDKGIEQELKEIHEIFKSSIKAAEKAGNARPMLNQESAVKVNEHLHRINEQAKALFLKRQQLRELCQRLEKLEHAELARSIKSGEFEKQFYAKVRQQIGSGFDPKKHEEIMRKRLKNQKKLIYAEVGKFQNKVQPELAKSEAYEKAFEQHMHNAVEVLKTTHLIKDADQHVVNALKNIENHEKCMKKLQNLDNELMKIQRMEELEIRRFAEAVKNFEKKAGGKKSNGAVV